MLYVYDLNDGQGELRLTKQLTVTTLAKAVPEIEIGKPEITDTTVKAKFDVTDTDNVCTVTSVKIFKGETEVAENTEKQIAFENLSYYTEYQVVVAYSYDLNDGEGIHNETATLQCKTSPHLAFNSCKVINTSAVSEGETIYMQATLDNPSGAVPTSAVVNGRTYNCASSTSAGKVYLEIVYNDQFEGGNTVLNIEKINMALDGKTYTVKTEENNSGTVFINGKLEVVSVQPVNSTGEPADWCLPDDNPYYLLTLKNKTGYTLDSVEFYVQDHTWSTAKTSTVTKIDDEHYKIDCDLSNNSGWNYITLSSVTYHNDYLNKTLGVGQESTRMFVTNGTTEIATLEQLLNTDFSAGCNYYKLTSDIDLSGMEWTNLGNFFGVFDGNGHKISGMSNVSTVTDKDIEIGLFAKASGVFIDVELTDITVMMTLKSTKAELNVYFGGLAAQTDYDATIAITNCTVEADVSFKNTTSQYGQIGGFVGCTYCCSQLMIDDCKSKVSLNCTDDDGQYIGLVGGLVGYNYSSDSSTSIANCEVSGNIKGNNVGGLIGYDNYSLTTVENCNVTVELTAKSMGGIVGLAHSYDIKVTGTTIDLKATSTSSDGDIYAGGLVANSSRDCNIQVSNTTVEMQVSNATYAGGLVAYQTGDIQASHVTANIEVDRANCVGGLVGGTTTSPATTIAIDNCNVTTIVDKLYHGGGLVGYAETVIIDNCEVTVVFRTALTDNEYISNAGGLVGSVTDLKVTNTTVNIEVQNAQSTGGVAGYVGKEFEVTSATVSIKAQKVIYAGGVVGTTGANNTCIVDSTVTIEATDIYSCAGGIAGNTSSATTIDNCDITATLSVTLQDWTPTYAGGLFGYLSCVGDISVSNSTFKVQIQKTGYAGGLVGHTSYTEKLNIDSCDISGKLDTDTAKVFGNNLDTENFEIKDTTYDLLINGVQQTNKPAQETEQEQ